MSVLVNLLPDIRLQRQRDAQRRQLVGGIAGLIVIVCAAFLILLFVVTSGQSILIKNTKTDIATKKATLVNTEGLLPAMTAQARLESITSLYNQRTIMTKLLAALSEVSPTTLQITSLKYSTADSTLEISGVIQSYADAMKLTKALEAAHTKIGTGSPSEVPYFTNVVLKSTSRGSGVSKNVAFTLSATVATGATHAK